MVATVMRISEDLRNFLNSTQQKLKKEIYEHHDVYNKLKADPKNWVLERKLKQIQNSIKLIGEEQQFAIHRIKLEVKEYGKKLQLNGLSRAILSRATNLNNAIQTAASKIKTPPSTSPTPSIPPITTSSEITLDPPIISEESSDIPSIHSPEPPSSPTDLEDLTQAQFLRYFGIVTHAVHDEMQKKRVERKRRSTANPQFFYGTKWEYPKRKRSSYLLSSISPPNTRQAAKNKAKVERPITPPSKDSSPGTSSPVNPKDLSLPKLPSGLTIERVVTPSSRCTPDPKLCIVCSLPGGCLTICDSCMNGFHMSCYNRPLLQPPKKCPKCIVDVGVRTVGNLHIPSDMTVSYVSSTDITETLQEKQKLLEENKSLSDELLKLQDHHSFLTMSMKQQKLTQQQLVETHHMTEDKIKKLLLFINSMKSPMVSSLQS